MNRVFWTPHSGYHGPGWGDRFFEGWYFRVTVPDQAQSFAFMYSIDDPKGNSDLSGGAAQILGPREDYLYCPLPATDRFWAWRNGLGLGHWGEATGDRPRYLSADAFSEQVALGYQATAHHHQGALRDRETGAIARWNYTIEPVYGWGSVAEPPQPTGGLWSYLPVFEPGWQVLMAHGRATGWIEWQGDRYDLQRCPAYAEKNWGGAFPQRWFWLQCNAFAAHPDLTITVAGAYRSVLDRLETVGLIGLHLNGQFIAFASLRDRLTWRVEPWGQWHITAENHRHRIEIVGICDRPPAQVRVPTREGLKFACWDTTNGQLSVTLWTRSPGQRAIAAEDAPDLQATSTLAGLEVGGSGWDAPWSFQSSPV
ncbi:MAG: tocopherol cyclase family protein [Leptolyngbyaceae cyanobacterium T60_A2020_046]|nr:tocopherol cyclase family protein [Leptolyngbyaceae cyanobacterium T60_A2020_046]